MSAVAPQPRDDRGAGPRAPRARLFTVSAVTAMVKNAIADGLPATIHVVGQISNFKRHGSGHLYFTLKDDASELPCVMWRSSASKLPFDPADGMEVVAAGYVDVFERAGRYQLYTRKLEPRGIGALELAFRQLRDKLSAEGLFDPKHKKPLPNYPQRVAVVTSPSGAAIRDVLQTMERRYPAAEVLIYPVAVQGPEAAKQIAAAIAELNRRRQALGGIDVMIVGRGGGSLEDLWAFNEEVVARAIFASLIPVVSAVGHEVDVTISDLVADLRAATPTAAAELVVPDRVEVLAGVERHRATLDRSMRHRLDLARLRLTSSLRQRPFAEPLAIVQRREQAVDDLETRLPRALLDRLHRAHRRLQRCEAWLQRIQPQAYLLRLDRRLSRSHTRLRVGVSQRFARAERQLASSSSRLFAVAPAQRLRRWDERVGHLADRLRRLMRNRLTSLTERVEGEASRLSALGYRRTLQRGFTITRTKKGRRVVRDSAGVAAGDRIVTETAAGEFESQVVDRGQLELFE